MPNKNLAQFFHPRSIAVIGASNAEGKVGNDVMLNLTYNFPGKIYPVNPYEAKIMDCPVFTAGGCSRLRTS
jgi:acetyltransferase